MSGKLDLDLTKPTLLVANHPNGLLDPLVVRIALEQTKTFRERDEQRILYLGKSTLFANIIGRTTARSFGAIPVYRKKDGQDTARNKSMFRAVYESLEKDAWVLIFAEGEAQDQATLQPLKSGTARIILGFNSPDLQVLPIGITYEQKSRFRSCANVHLGQLVPHKSPLPNVEEKTAEVSSRLRAAMFEAPSEAHRNDYFYLARWLSKNAPFSIVEPKAKKLFQAHQTLKDNKPQKAEAIRFQISDFVTKLNQENLKAWELDFSFSIKAAVFLLLFFPLFLVGFSLNFPLLLIILWIVQKLAKNAVKLFGTMKTLGGVFFFPLSWILTFLTFSILYNVVIGLLGALSMALLAGFTLFYFERLKRFRQWWRRYHLARRKPELDAELLEIRADIEGQINEMMSEDLNSVP